MNFCFDTLYMVKNKPFWIADLLDLLRCGTPLRNLCLYKKCN